MTERDPSSSSRPLWRRILRGALSRVGLAVLAITCVTAGFLLHAMIAPAAPETAAGDVAGDDVAVYTCSMHPQIRSTDPEARCPICAMALVPVAESGGERSLRQFSTSEQALALMDVQTTPAQRRFVSAEIRMVGKVDYDETRLSYVSARMPGRLDRLYVDYTGLDVREGDHMAEIYSPALLAAQEELLQARRSVAELSASDNGIVRQTAETTLAASREKLRLLGLTAGQIDEIERTGEVSDHLTLYSPVAGVVVHKHAKEGMYVETGTKIYTVADLSVMWVRMEAYESDLMWLRYGQDVAFTSVSHPGKVFHGRISFIDPVLDRDTRTVKVRVSVRTPKRRLKPGMFVTAIVTSRVAAGGRVMAPDLAGKWICRMHPDVIRDGPGACGVCEMDLVTAESLGYVAPDAAEAKPLVVPASAVLRTGKRAVVYVRTDPSLLAVDSITDWDRLVGELKSYRAQDEQLAAGGILNTRCPIMGGKINLANVTEELTRSSGDGKVAFCCAGCPQRWDDLGDDEKALKLAAVMSGESPLELFWTRVGQEMQKRLIDAADGPSIPTPLKHRFVRRVNERVIARRDFATAADWPDAALPDEARRLLSVGAENLPRRDLTRLNRLLVGGLLVNVLAEASDETAFEGREIVLGPRAGDWYVVGRGLAAGESVVTRGAFKIDSALQIEAKPSMMDPQGGLRETSAPGAHAHGEQDRPVASDGADDVDAPPSFHRQLRAVTAAGEAVLAAGAIVDADVRRKLFEALAAAVEATDASLLEGRALLVWRELSMRLANDAALGTQAETASDAREAVAALESDLATLAAQFGRAALRQAHAGRAASAMIVNDACPIMGTPLDAGDVPADLTRSWRGRTIGFCCAGCPEQWDTLSDAKKARKLQAVVWAESPVPNEAAQDFHGAHDHD